MGAKGHIRHQDEPLGTAHAILCGKDFLEGPVVVAFADTLFRADFTIDPEADGVLFANALKILLRLGWSSQTMWGPLSTTWKSPRVGG